MNAKDFLNTLKLPKRSRGEDESDITWLYYEKGVIEAMEKYHQSKVDNVVLDDVVKCECKKPNPVNFTHLKHLYCSKCEGRLSFL